MINWPKKDEVKNASCLKRKLMPPILVGCRFRGSTWADAVVSQQEIIFSHGQPGCFSFPLLDFFAGRDSALKSEAQYPTGFTSIHIGKNDFFFSPAHSFRQMRFRFHSGIAEFVSCIERASV